MFVANKSLMIAISSTLPSHEYGCILNCLSMCTYIICLMHPFKSFRGGNSKYRRKSASCIAAWALRTLPNRFGVGEQKGKGEERESQQ